MLIKEELLKEISIIDNEDSLNVFYQNYLGKKGEIAMEYKKLGNLGPEERKNIGQFLSNLKEELENIYNIKQQDFNKQKINKLLEADIIDISTPGIKIKENYLTLITKTRQDVEEIFRSMGFHIEYGHDMVTKYENFYSVNIPSTHPATQMHDTFYIEQKDSNGENLILRTHTSAMQTFLAKKYGVPLKVVVPGKVYRYENTDASHDTVFRQIEGMVIDKNISIANFKYTMSKILSSIFKADISVRIRPAFFPFVEPGFEIDATCPICISKGCSLCKNTGWIEILGAGMIHPNVLKECLIDPNQYTGFAYGMGLTRLVAIRYGIKDVRLFTNGDLRFLKSF